MAARTRTTRLRLAMRAPLADGNEAPTTHVTVEADVVAAGSAAAVPAAPAEAKPTAREPAERHAPRRHVATGHVRQPVDGETADLPWANGSGRAANVARRAMPEHAPDRRVPETTETKARPKIEVVASATFLPPVSARATIAPLAGSIGEALAEPAETESPSATRQGHDGSRVSRRLEIELHPRELGTVRVNLVSRGGEISVEIISTTHEAHDLLQTHKDALVDAIRHAGAAGGDVSVRIVSDPSANRDFQSGQNQGQHASGNGAANANGDGSSGNRRQGADGFQNGTPPARADRSSAAETPGEQRQGIYL